MRRTTCFLGIIVCLLISLRTDANAADMLGNAWLTLRAEQAQITRTRATWGIAADDVLGGAMAQNGVDGAPPQSLDVERALPLVEALAARIRRPMRSPRYVDDRVVPGRAGLQLDVWRTLQRLRDASPGQRSVEAVVVRTEPPLDERTLRKQNFIPLGAYKTHFAARKKARTRNLAIAAEKMDGFIVPPNGIFDFNKIVGDRTLSNGFVPATVISDGELADGLGGGACQIASTLHAAALFSGMTIETHHPHSRPSSYIRLGLDATVAFPRLNYVFRNPQPTPVVVRVWLEHAQVHATILGAESETTIRVARRITSWSGYPERRRDRNDLAKGTRILSQRGVPGFVVSMTRNIGEATEAWELRYPPVSQVWAVGTGSTTRDDTVHPDEHGEYTAHEVVLMDWNAETGDIDVQQRRGTPGTPGWTKSAGYPQPSSSN